MKELPRVSVAIITYQHENYVQECLESIVNQQGLFELEIMIFDDHSQDGVAAFCAHSPRSAPGRAHNRR